jgi:hypothetical protein
MCRAVEQSSVHWVKAQGHYDTTALQICMDDRQFHRSFQGVLSPVLSVSHLFCWPSEELCSNIIHIYIYIHYDGESRHRKALFVQHFLDNMCSWPQNRRSENFVDELLWPVTIEKTEMLNQLNRPTPWSDLRVAWPINTTRPGRAAACRRLAWLMPRSEFPYAVPRACCRACGCACPVRQRDSERDGGGGARRRRRSLRRGALVAAALSQPHSNSARRRDRIRPSAGVPPGRAWSGGPRWDSGLGCGAVLEKWGGAGTRRRSSLGVDFFSCQSAQTF